MVRSSSSASSPAATRSEHGRKSGPARTGRFAVPFGRWAFEAEVLVQGHDETVTLELRPGMPVTGRIVFDGATPPPADASGLQIYLTPMGIRRVSPTDLRAG